MSWSQAAEPGGAVILRRRQLLRGGFWAGAIVLLAGGIASAADFLAPRGQQQFGGVITVAATDVPNPGGPPHRDETGKFWLINLKPGEGGVPLFDGSGLAGGRGEGSHSGGLLALYERCPHLGTPVPWRPTFVFGGVEAWFRCPSHGATFTKAGLWVFGPAPHSMDTFPIVHAGQDGVAVNTGHVLLGGADDPQRTVPVGPFG